MRLSSLKTRFIGCIMYGLYAHSRAFPSFPSLPTSPHEFPNFSLANATRRDAQWKNRECSASLGTGTRGSPSTSFHCSLRRDQEELDSGLTRSTDMEKPSGAQFLLRAFASTRLLNDLNERRRETFELSSPFSREYLAGMAKPTRIVLGKLCVRGCMARGRRARRGVLRGGGRGEATVEQGAKQRLPAVC
jgi:hypothetical protein